MNLILYKHHSFIHCLMLNLKDQTFSTDSRRPFLEIDVKGGERDHIKAYHLQGGERDPQGERILKDPICMIIKRRDTTCLFGGKTCSYVLVCTQLYSFDIFQI